MARTGCSGKGYFDELKARGLHGVKMVISDGHRGILQVLHGNSAMSA